MRAICIKLCNLILFDLVMKWPSPPSPGECNAMQYKSVQARIDNVHATLNLTQDIQFWPWYYTKISAGKRKFSFWNMGVFLVTSEYEFQKIQPLSIESALQKNYFSTIQRTCAQTSHKCNVRWTFHFGHRSSRDPLTKSSKQSQLTNSNY